MHTTEIYIDDVISGLHVHALTSFELLTVGGRNIIRFYAGTETVEVDIESLRRMAHAAGLR